MHRTLPLIVVIIVSGCNHSVNEPPPESPTVPATTVTSSPWVADEPNRVDLSLDGYPIVLDTFATLPSVEGEPIDVGPDLDCSLIGPDTFTTWPSVTDEPIDVGPGPWTVCSSPPTTEYEREHKAAEDAASGPHANYSITVRVSPNAVEAFRDGNMLPPGAVVVKEKHASYGSATRYFVAYALMIKHEEGYDAMSGDWEYAYVTMRSKRTATLGRLKKCTQCHSKASDRDYLFRSYLAEGK